MGKINIFIFLGAKTILKQKSVFAPCGGYIIVRDRKGTVVHNEVYVSNASNAADCSDGFLKHLATVIAEFSPNDFKYETDVDFNG